jgi:hypothetical protein
MLHNLLRHVCHLAEVENIAVETITHLIGQQEAYFKLLPSGLTATYQSQAKEYLSFQLQLMNGLKCRAEASKERLQGEITLVS